MTRLISLAVLSFASLAWSADVFPWEGSVTLENATNQQLTWTVKRTDGGVVITGSHPKWKVEHHAKPDGTPVSTVRRANGVTVTIRYTDEGAELERVDARGQRSITSVRETGLWDSDTVDARLAGVPWAKGKKVRLKVLDVEKADGTAYPMVAEYAGEQTCGTTPCHRVHLALDDFRRLFAPTFEYRYGTGPGAPFLHFEGDGQTFTVR